MSLQTSGTSFSKASQLQSSPQLRGQKHFTSLGPTSPFWSLKVEATIQHTLCHEAADEYTSTSVQQTGHGSSLGYHGSQEVSEPKVQNDMKRVVELTCSWIHSHRAAAIMLDI